MHILNADEVLELHHQLPNLDKRKLYIPYTEFREQVDSAFESFLPEVRLDVWAAAWNLLLRIGAEKPFLDGNKRTAWHSIILLLEKNGYVVDQRNGGDFQPFPIILKTLDPACENYTMERICFISSLKSIVSNA